MNDTDRKNRLTAFYTAIHTIPTDDQKDWHMEGDSDPRGALVGHNLVNAHGEFIANFSTERDARLVVAMRNAIPAIVAEIGDLHNLRTAVKASGGQDGQGKFATWEELAHENRRLRTMMDALARAGLGTVALVEVFQEVGRRGITVTRVDGDEEAFLASVRTGLEALAATFGLKITETRRVGVTEEPEK